MCLLCPLALEEEGWEGLLGAEVLGNKFRLFRPCNKRSQQLISKPINLI